MIRPFIIVENPFRFSLNDLPKEALLRLIDEVEGKNINQTILNSYFLEQKLIHDREFDLVNDDLYIELGSSIVDVFEQLLYDKGIQIPSNDREGHDFEAAIYGSEYYDLEEGVIQILKPYL